MVILPPGTLLQLMYLRERLSSIKAGKFIEIGPGSGEITKILLDLGWHGFSYDLDKTTIDKLKIRFAREINEDMYEAISGNFIASLEHQKIDLVISCMVMEHLSESAELDFIKKSKLLLKDGGILIGIVPSSPNHWGIEDAIAGHFRRYTRERLKELFCNSGFKLEHLVGLTFPMSNFLLPLSNFLVHKSERQKLPMSQIDKTKLSGRRNVKFKTNFPVFFIFFINKITIYPFFILQKIFKNSKQSLILYFEAKNISEVRS